MTERYDFRNKSMNFWINFWFSNHLEWLIFFSFFSSTISERYKIRYKSMNFWINTSISNSCRWYFLSRFFSSTVGERYKIRYKSMNLWINTSISNGWRWYFIFCFFCSGRPLIVYSIISIWYWFLISISLIYSHNVFIHKVPDIVVYLFIANVLIQIILLRKRTWMSKFSIIFIRYWWFNLFIYIYYIFIHKMKNIIIYFFIADIFLLCYLLSKWVCFRSFPIFFKFSILLILDSFRFIKNRSWISFVAVWISLQIKHIIWKSRNPRIVSFLSKRRWFWFIIKNNRSIKLDCLWDRE